MAETSGNYTIHIKGSHEAFLLVTGIFKFFYDEENILEEYRVKENERKIEVDIDASASLESVIEETYPMICMLASLQISDVNISIQGSIDNDYGSNTVFEIMYAEGNATIKETTYDIEFEDFDSDDEDLMADEDEAYMEALVDLRSKKAISIEEYCKNERISLDKESIESKRKVLLNYLNNNHYLE